MHVSIDSSALMAHKQYGHFNSPLMKSLALPHAAPSRADMLSARRMWFRLPRLEGWFGTITVA
jgi:hypothetical protein